MLLDDYQRTRTGVLRSLMLMIDRATNRSQAYKDAGARCGYSAKRMESMFSAWRKAGDDALIDRRKLKQAKSNPNTIILSETERNELKNIAGRCDSYELAIELYGESPTCRPEIREIIQRFKVRRNYPKILRRYASLTAEERDLIRGNKRFQMRAYTQLRKNTYLDAAGVEHPLLGGDLFECDDMSLNQPFWYEWPYGGDPLSDKFGVRLGRQMLACVDTATGNWLGFDLIGRVRDAYRAEDVVRFLGNIGQMHGFPRLGFRLEKGVWASNSIRGVRGVTDDGEKEIIGSVREAVDLHYVFHAKAKGIIEGSFNFLQRVLALYGIQIGRTRGEYERTTQLMLACANGSKHPADWGFPYISEAAERVAHAMERVSNRNKMGRLLKGIPQEKFSQAVEARPLLKMPAEKMHLFMPVKEVRPIDGGFVRYKVPHYSHTFSFEVPGDLARLGRGYRLLVCFDPANPHAGAHVFDAEKDARIHVDSVQGEYYGVFAYKVDAPNLDLSRSGDYSGKKSYTAAARTVFRGVGLQIGTGASIEHRADGHGNATRIVQGINPQQAAPTPAATVPGSRAAAALQGRRKHVEQATRGNRAADVGRAIAREIPHEVPTQQPAHIEQW